jgi:hypothetical protein
MLVHQPSGRNWLRWWLFAMAWLAKNLSEKVIERFGKLRTKAQTASHNNSGQFIVAGAHGVIDSAKVDIDDTVECPAAHNPVGERYVDLMRVNDHRALSARTQLI